MKFFSIYFQKSSLKNIFLKICLYLNTCSEYFYKLFKKFINQEEDNIKNKILKK